jgi:iron complex outermembrane recepter protein
LAEAVAFWLISNWMTMRREMKVITTKNYLFLAMLVVFCAVLPLNVLAEEPISKDQAEEPISIGEITVKGEASTTDPTTVNIVTSEDIDQLKLSRPEQLLEEIPGVEIHNYSQGGVANEFEMRGFNNCGHGGDAAITIDGIPLNESQSHADGYADMNVIIPLEIDHVDVFKGPSSPLFGNYARGGAISFNTKKTGEYSTLQATWGSYDSYDAQYALGHSFSDTFRNNTALQLASTGGYQDNSSWQRENLSTRFAWKPMQDLDLAVSFRFHKSVWDAPGYIPKYQFDDEDASFHQAVNAQNDGGDKLFTTQRLDAGYHLTGNSKLLVWAYATEQDFTRFAKMGYDPGGQTEKHHERFVYGAGTSYNYKGQLAEKHLSAVAGIEYYSEDTDTDIYNTTNRARTSQSQDRNFVLNTLSLFGQVDYGLHPLFQPWVGLRYDTFSGDYHNNDPGATPFVEDINDYSPLSPKIGFRSQLFDSLIFRTSYTQGFSLPSDDQKYDAAVGDKEEIINQYEVGLNFTPNRMLTADLALFRIDDSHEIQEYPAGSGVFIDVGETRRDGLEFSTVFSPWVTGLELFGDVTGTHTEILDNADENLIGKHVTGVPDYSTTLGIRYRSSNGIFSQIKWRHVDQYYIDSENLETYDGYDVTDFTISYTGITQNATKWRVGGGIDNLFDEHYSQAVWSGYGTTNYAVSAPRTFWLRLTLFL